MSVVLIVELFSDALFGLIKLKKEGKTLPNRNKKTNGQNYELRGVFNKIKYPSTDTKKDIGTLLNLSLKSINVWFQNERQTIRCNKNNRSRSIEVDSKLILELYFKALELYNI